LDQKNFKAKSLELIHITKEFLQLEKTYEDSLGVLIVIKKARMLGRNQLKALPGKVLELVHNAANLDEAEKLTIARMSELRKKMDSLSQEIKKLSEELQPYFSELKQTKKTNPPKITA
jgi:uncharacterized coiled-coil DUF342 family protein